MIHHSLLLCWATFNLLIGSINSFSTPSTLVRYQYHQHSYQSSPFIQQEVVSLQPSTHHVSKRPRSSSTSLASSSIISSTNNWGNIAALSFTASLAQLLGKTTLIGKLLGAPVTAMALTFCLSSISLIPTLSGQWKCLLPPGGSAASTFLQGTSLTLATPLLLLGTSIRGKALKQCGSLLGSFLIASLGTLLGCMLAFSPILGIQSSLVSSLPNSDGIKIAAALLAKNIGGGINYMAVCACLGASTESIAAGLCVDNVMALVYFPLTSMIASKYDDVTDDEVVNEAESDVDQTIINESKDSSTTSVEALSHAFTIAAVLTALGQFFNSQLHHIPACSSQVNLSLPITTLLAVLYSTYYPANKFLSPTSTTSNNDTDNKPNAIAKAGETLGTTLLYLFFATAGAAGWKLKDSIQQSFRPIASFLIILYSVHGAMLYGTKKIVNILCGDDKNGKNQRFWSNMVAPQRLLVGSSCAIGGPATAAALAKSFEWKSLLSPSLLVGNVGYAIATFIGLLFYGAYR